MGLFDRWVNKFLGRDGESEEEAPAPEPLPEDPLDKMGTLDDDHDPDREFKARIAQDVNDIVDYLDYGSDSLGALIGTVRSKLTLDVRGRRYAESNAFVNDIGVLDGGGRRRAADGLLADAMLISRSIDLRRRLAERLLDRGDTDGARILLEELKGHDAHATFAWTALGDIAETTGDADEALRCYEHVLALDATLSKAKSRARRLRGQLENQRGGRQKTSALARFLGARAAGARYAVREEVGRGGAATVFRATDRVMGREVALKIYHPRGDADERRARLLEEARVAGRFDHPHIVPIFDVDAERDLLVMAYCREGSLRDRMSEGKLPLIEVAEFGAVLLRTLDDIHQTGEVHLDIKPSNVLFSGGQIQVCDFGTAGLLHMGRQAGTRMYMAPEQREKAEAGPPADMYATGLLLYEALTGHLPDKTAVGVPEIVLHDFPDGPRRRGLEVFLRWMCARNPADRPQRGADAAQVLLDVVNYPLTDDDALTLRTHLEALARQRGLDTETWRSDPFLVAFTG